MSIDRNRVSVERRSERDAILESDDLPTNLEAVVGAGDSRA